MADDIAPATMLLQGVDLEAQIAICVQDIHHRLHRQSERTEIASLQHTSTGRPEEPREARRSLR